MDGARIYNAATALNTTVAELARDAIRSSSVSQSARGTVGSILVGSADFVHEARIGGNVWAAECDKWELSQLPDGRSRGISQTPTRDHANARRLAEGLAEIPGITIEVERVVTNIVIFDIIGTGKGSNEICAALKDKNILAIPFGTAIRMVTHYDVSAAEIDSTIEALRRIGSTTNEPRTTP